MLKSGTPYGFVCSASPLMLNLDGFPRMGSECRSDDPEAIRKFEEELEPFRIEMRNALNKEVEKRGAKCDPEKIDKPVTEHPSIYSYPKEIDYYNEELQTKFHLLQIDSPL